MEEWWGRTFESRGTIDVPNMPDNTPKTIKRLSTPDLLELIRSEDQRSVRGLIAHMERNRRENWTARFAISIALLSLIASIASLVLTAVKQ